MLSGSDDKRARMHEARVEKLQNEIVRLRRVINLADRALKSLAPGMPFISFDVAIVNDAMIACAKEVTP